MTSRGLLNTLAIVTLCVAMYVVTASLRQQATTPVTPNVGAQAPEAILIEHTPDGAPAVRDARGALVPIAPYKRIAAASIVSMEVVQSLVENDRVVAYSVYKDPGGAWKYSDKPRLGKLSDVESILALRPDIVFYNGPSSASAIARLREHDIQLFDLGRMTGLASYLHMADLIMTVIDNPERFERYRYEVQRAAHSVICKPISDHPDIMYVGLIASTMFGGTRGTSYSDIIRLAGMHDAAAERFKGWPQYSDEDLLSIDPPWILAPEGTAQSLCNTGQLRYLRACRNHAAHIVELPPGILGGAGTSIITSAQKLFDAVHGPCTPVDTPAETPKPGVEPSR